MSSHGDPSLHSDKNETDERYDPITALHVSEARPQDLVQLKISRRSGFNQNHRSNPNKISISTIPHDELEEFKGFTSGKSLSNSQDGVFMITLAGENLGANMAIRNTANSPLATPYVNNNVQSINNSALQESSNVARDPGVHLKIVSSREDKDLVNDVSTKEPNFKERRGLNLKMEKRPENEPRVRRRCLRALFLESDSDIEDAGKPRRHGCRLKCEDKREKEKERDGGGGGISTSGKV